MFNFKLKLLSLIVIILSSFFFFNPEVHLNRESEGLKINEKYISILDGLQTELSYATLFGGNSSESYPYIMEDKNGDVWISGYTSSPDFPTTPNAFNTTYGGSIDLFIAKFDGTNNQLLYATYFGGSGYEIPNAINVDKKGNIWIVGETGSTNFPTTPNAFNNTLNGLVDMFLLELSPYNYSILYSTYFGGADTESISFIDFDQENNIWFTGITNSADFPITSNGYFTTYNGSFDTVVSELSENKAKILYSSFIGGTADDYCYSIKIENNNDVWLLGFTYSFDFPLAGNSMNTSNNGNSDIFIVEMSNNGTILTYSSYLGGYYTDQVYSSVLDDKGNIWITGSTYSSDFPITANAYDPIYNGNNDCFVLMFNTTSKNLEYSSFIGGTTNDKGTKIVIDKNDAIWISGTTSSTNFPITENAYKKVNNGYSDIFILSLASNGSVLYYSTYFGGSNSEYFADLVLTSSGKIWVTGETQSSDYPTTMDAYDTIFEGYEEVFIISLNLLTKPSEPINLTAFECCGGNILVTWDLPLVNGNSPINTYNIYKNTSLKFDETVNQTNNQYFIDSTIDLGIQYYYTVSAVNDIGEGLFSNIISIIVNNPTTEVATVTIPTTSTETITETSTETIIDTSTEITTETITTQINNSYTSFISSISTKEITATITKQVSGFLAIMIFVPVVIIGLRRKYS